MDVSKFSEIMQTLVGAGQLVQTHASAVYITDEYVYKMKKPVDFGFLNYTQLKQRRAYCYLEKDLNSRFSESIYLDVMKLIERGAGAFELVPAENSLPALEYVLKMVRIPDELFLSNQLDTISPDKMEYIGAQIAKRLSVAEASPEIVDKLGVFEQIDFNCKENFSQLEESAPKIIKQDNRYDFIKKVTLDFLAANKEMFIKRHAAGFVKDGHGDLRMEHIYIDKESDKVSLIDCIEFNNRFRINDVINEAGFLSMELDYSSHIDLSDAFLKGFYTVYNDADSHTLLNFYRCYRAVVRAKIAIFTMLGYAEGSAEHTAKYEEFQRMMDMAVCYALSVKQIQPLVFCGMIASGKSKNGKAFAARFPVQRVNTDEERKIFAGMDIQGSGVTTYEQGLYTEESSLRVYEMLGQKAAAAIATGRIPLVDGTFLKRGYQANFEKAFSVPPIYIEFFAPEEVILERLRARENKASVSDGRVIHYEKMKASAVRPAVALSIDSTGAVEDNIEAVLGYLYAK